MTLEAFLSRLDGVRGGGEWYLARCPAHDDREASLGLRQGDRGLILKCHAGCTAEAIVTAMGLRLRDLFGDDQAVNPRSPGGGYSIPSRTPATVQPGLTLAQYAAAKQLPVDFLRALGLSDAFIGQNVVRIPYLDEGGDERAIRFRLSLNGAQRFKWKTGTTPCLYGLVRLAEARAANEVVLVEGESDSQTLWYNQFHALGLPGASSWRPEWATALDGIGRIYVLIEPDQGGLAVLKWLATVPFRDRVRLVHLAGAKDVSGLYCADPMKFRLQFLVALD